MLKARARLAESEVLETVFGSETATSLRAYYTRAS
jgi:hypothetical protein